MTGDEQIKQALKSFSRTTAATMIGSVTEVDEAQAIISVDLGNGFIIDDVRLRATVDENTGGDHGFYVIPKVGSMVFIIRIGPADDFVAVGFEKYDKIICKGENASFVVTNDQVIFNDNELDSYGVDINNLIDKINQLEQHVNNLKTVFTNWIPVPQDGGYSLKTAALTWAGQQITQTTVDNIKDPKILN